MDMSRDTFWLSFNAFFAGVSFILMFSSIFVLWNAASPRTRMHIIGFCFILFGLAAASTRNAIIGDRPPNFWTPFFTAGTLMVTFAYLLPVGLTQTEFEEKLRKKEEKKARRNRT